MKRIERIGLGKAAMRSHLTTFTLMIIFSYLSSQALGSKAESSLHARQYDPPAAHIVSIFHADHTKSSPLSAVPKLVKRARRWTREDDKDLLELGDTDLSWKEIAKLMPMRTPLALKKRYRRLNKNRPHTQGRFSDIENELLLELRKANMPWDEMVEWFSERSMRTLQYQYRALKSSTPKRAASPRLWTPEEEKKLLELGDRGFSWEEMAKFIPGRTPFAVREHYKLVMDQKSFTAEEEKLLLRLRKADISWDNIAVWFRWRSIQTLKRQYRASKSSTTFKRREWTPEDDDRLIEAFQAHKTTKEISQSLERSYWSVEDRINSLIESARIKRRKQPKYVNAEFELMREKRRQGMSWKKIARKYFPERTEGSLSRSYRSYWTKMERKKNKR